MIISYREYKQVITERARRFRKQPTVTERALWQHLRGKKVAGYKFLRQYPILHDQKGRVRFFIADFYCHEKKMIIEVDGDVHDSKEQKLHDEMRGETLQEMGYNILRFQNEEVLYAIQDVLERIQVALQKQSSSSPF